MNSKQGARYIKRRMGNDLKQKILVQNGIIFIESNAKKHYQKEYSQWLPIQTLKEQREEWKPCEYFDQMNKALTASHSILNYSIFLSLLLHKKSLKAPSVALRKKIKRSILT
jgi:hypothetical protein